MMRRLLLLTCLLVCASASAEVRWSQFRGNQGDGVADAKRVPVSFGPDSLVQWQVDLPGKGWSSPVIGEESIWVTAAEDAKASDDEKQERLTKAGTSEKNFKSLQVANSIRLLAIEVGLADGGVRRVIELGVVEKPDSIHSLNSYASPTPFLENHRLYAHFGTFGTFCVDTESGEVIWGKQLPLDHGVGPGSSPFIHDDLLVLICDGVDQQYVTALNKVTGDQVWKTERPEMRATSGDRKKAYCTPIRVRAKGAERDQLICLGAQWLVSYDPLTGIENWKVDHGSGFSVVPRPVFSEKQQLIYISTGFIKPELWAVSPQGEVAWKYTKRIPARPSPILVGDELYVVTDGGIASCIDAMVGEVHWTERLGGNFSASPMFADGKLYFANHEGKVIVIEAGTSYQKVAENDLEEQIMATPVALDDRLFIRTVTKLYCFSESEPESRN